MLSFMMAISRSRRVDEHRLGLIIRVGHLCLLEKEERVAALWFFWARRSLLGANKTFSGELG